MQIARSHFSSNYKFVPSAGGQAPDIVSPLRDQFGADRGSVTFDCEISGTPKPEISWFRGTKELVETSKFTILDKGTKQVLIVRNLHLEDEDEYTCKATNSMGTRTTRAQLKISCKFQTALKQQYLVRLSLAKF